MRSEASARRARRQGPPGLLARADGKADSRPRRRRTAEASWARALSEWTSARAAPGPAFSIRRGGFSAAARRAIAIWREPADAVEQSSADIWRAVTEAVREAVEASRLPREAIAGLGFAATCSLLALDERLEPLSVNSVGAPERDVIVWMDHRAAEDAARINAAGHDALRYAGGALSPEMQTPKLVWLARSKPQMFARSAHFLGLTDWLSFRATGSLARSLCTVACKFGYLAHERRWPGEFFDSVGLRAFGANGFARLGARHRRPGDAARARTDRRSRGCDGAQSRNAGRSRADRRTRRRARHARRPGARQARRSAAPAGAYPRHVVELHGAVGRAALHRRGLGPALLRADARPMADGRRPVGVRRGDRPSRASASGLRGGVAGRARCAGRVGSPIAPAVFPRRRCSPSALHVLPSFIGRRAPAADAAARGGIVGLDLREDAASLEELYVAGLCGLAYGIADIVEAFERAGYGFETIVVSGGAAQSALVRQIVSDACGKVGVDAGDVRAGAARFGDDRRCRGREGNAALRDGVDVGARTGRTEPASGPVAAFHARKRRALAILERAEREVRKSMRATRWPKVVIFDCDGVLVDSEVISLGVTRRMLAEAGLRLSDDETRKRFLGRRQDAVLRASRSRTRLPLAERLYRRAVARNPCDVRARPERRRGRPAGCRGARRAGLRRLLERAGAAALRAARDGLREPCSRRISSPPPRFRAASHNPDLFLFAARSMGADPGGLPRHRGQRRRRERRRAPPA